MKKFIKYYTIFVCIYFAICSFAVLSFCIVADGKGKHYQQIYYLDSCDYNAFLNKYKELYLSRSVDSLDSFIFVSDTLKTGGYKTEIEEYIEDQFVIGQDSASRCNYYLSSVDGRVSFRVIDNVPLKLELNWYCPSVKKSQEKQWKYGRGYSLNSMFIPYSDNEEILDAFEQSFLVEFGSYRRDHLQEWETKYRSFLEKIFVENVTHLLIFEVLSILLAGSLFLIYSILLFRELIISIRKKEFFSAIRKEIDDFLY